MTTYEITDRDGTTVYLEGDAETVLSALLRHNIKFVEPDGTRVRVYRV